ncbi:PR domain zinc finger protein 13-like [Antedon mediterranea]|uniref:PR domain zinc finger protein 13-like n=1 Tax=Antedon mediterranea TaxID=105859 RepID=UPI003AF40D86
MPIIHQGVLILTTSQEKKMLGGNVHVLRRLRGDAAGLGRDGDDTGVLCASEIPGDFLLGSLQGELRIGDCMKDERTSPYMLQIKCVGGKIVSSDGAQGSGERWMRFISAARNDDEQNTEASTNSNGQVILRTTRRILIGEELLVWYSDKLQRIMNILPVLPSRDHTGQLRYICQFCSKSFHHPNTLKAHIRFNCGSDSLKATTMRLSLCQPVSCSKNSFDLGFPLGWSTKTSHYLNPMFDISLLRSLAHHTMTHNESPSRGFRAFQPVRKCEENHRGLKVKTNKAKDQIDKISGKQFSPLELETNNSPIVPSGFDLPSRLHSRLINPSFNLSPASLGAVPFHHLNAPPPCVLYGCACCTHNHIDIPPAVESHHRHPLDFSFRGGSDHRSMPSSAGVIRHWPFHTLPTYPTDNCSGPSNSKLTKHQKPPQEPQLFLQNTSPQASKSKRGHLCIYCGKFYSRKYGLKIHLRTHTGYKPLKCKVCLRPFGDPSNLNKHIRLHAEGETPYRCEFCGKVLVRRRDLERHIKSRHPTKADTTSSQNKDDDELINVDDISSSSLMCDSDSEDEPMISKESPESNTSHESCETTS